MPQNEAPTSRVNPVIAWCLLLYLPILFSFTVAFAWLFADGEVPVTGWRGLLVFSGFHVLYFAITLALYGMCYRVERGGPE